MKPEKQLYQWDTNQSLVELTPTAKYVDYPIGDEVIRLETAGTRCRIPDEVLQTYGGKTCYERYPDGTYRAYSFTVLYAPKPPDYVFTPEERTTFEALTARVDAAIEDIKRRADSGEFDGKTPVKGVDYFTDAEKNEMMESVSDGAIGEFRKVVDTATTEYNDNHNLQLAKYNANASEKLTTYDTNAEQHTTDYNRNAEVKLEAYNKNHAEKVAEYNQNAAALQTEVDRLRGECDTLAAENRKQENRISALMKLNKGQTYDILPEEGEAASRTAPSGSKYVSVDKVGGKSVVWNQLLDYTKAPKTTTDNGITYTNNMDGTFTATGTAGDSGYSYIGIPVNVVAKHTYLSMSTQAGSVGKSYLTGEAISTNAYDRGNGAIASAKTTGVAYLVVQYYEAGQTVAGEIAKPQLYDLTQMLGAGNEPTIDQFKKLFAQKIYPYSTGEIISARTETITAGAETITTGFPELRSALAAHDYIDMDGGKVHRKIKSVRIDGDTPIYGVSVDSDANCCRIVFENQLTPGIIGSKNEKVKSNVISNRLATISHADYWNNSLRASGINIYESLQAVCFRLHDRMDIDTKEKAKAWLAENPTTVYYEIESEELEDVTIPEALQEWLPVEAGGTVTFRNADNSKQLAVPNAVSWVRKLDEVE